MRSMLKEHEDGRLSCPPAQGLEQGGYHERWEPLPSTDVNRMLTPPRSVSDLGDVSNQSGGLMRPA